MLKNNKKKVVSIIWGYHTHMYNFAPEENYHLHFLKVAKESGFKPYAIVKGNKENMENDPNFDKDIEVIDYKNFFQFIFLIIRFSLQNSLFYVNSYEWQSFIVPFISRKTIFMAHTQPKRQTNFKQNVQNFVYRFFTAIRLNNETEKEFLMKQGVPVKKLSVVPLTIATNIFKFQNDNINTRKDLICLGNISSIKNIQTIIKALALVNIKHPQIKLNIVGKNYDENFLKTEFTQNKNIVLHGYMAQDEKLVNLLNSTLISVNSSISEGQCVAIYDTALCGNVLCLPKIMSFEQVFNNKALFHDTYDHKKLAENILYYLNNPDIITKHRDGCIKMIKSEYSKEIIENKLRNLINNIK